MARMLSVVFGILALAVLAQKAHAQFYKGKTITMIVNYPAGGPTDLEGRIVRSICRRVSPAIRRSW